MVFPLVMTKVSKESEVKKKKKNQITYFFFPFLPRFSLQQEGSDEPCAIRTQFSNLWSNYDSYDEITAWQLTCPSSPLCDLICYAMSRGDWFEVWRLWSSVWQIKSNRAWGEYIWRHKFLFLFLVFLIRQIYTINTFSGILVSSVFQFLEWKQKKIDAMEFNSQL